MTHKPTNVEATKNFFYNVYVIGTTFFNVYYSMWY